MIEPQMEKIQHKIILDITLLDPFVNKQPGIVSTLRSPNGKESIRKMKYQPDEKEVFADAGISLQEVLDERILLSRTIDCGGVSLAKIDDKQFRAETPKYQTPELANRDAVNMLETISQFMESNGHIIDKIIKTKCKSGKIEVTGQKESVMDWCDENAEDGYK